MRPAYDAIIKAHFNDPARADRSTVAIRSDEAIAGLYGRVEGAPGGAGRPVSGVQSGQNPARTGSQGIQGRLLEFGGGRDLFKPELEPNFDQAAADRLATANENYRTQLIDRFHTGAVGDVLRSGRDISGYHLSNSQVPRALFRGGVQGAEAADSLIRAAGSREGALQVLGDYPALSLRQAAAPDGALNLNKYRQWPSVPMKMRHATPGSLALRV